MQETVASTIGDAKPTVKPVSTVKKGNVARKSTTKTPNFEKRVQNGNLLHHNQKLEKKPEIKSSENGSHPPPASEKKATKEDKPPSSESEKNKDTASPAPKVAKLDKVGDDAVNGDVKDGAVKQDGSGDGNEHVNGAKDQGNGQIKGADDDVNGHDDIGKDAASPAPSNAMDLLEDSLRKLRETGSSRDSSPARNDSESVKSAKESEKSDSAVGSPFSISAQTKDMFKGIKQSKLLQRRGSSDSVMSDKSCDSTSKDSLSLAAAAQKNFMDKGNLFEKLSDLAGTNDKESINAEEAMDVDKANVAEDGREQAPEGSTEAIKDDQPIDESVLDDSSDEKEAAADAQDYVDEIDEKKLLEDVEPETKNETKYEDKLSDKDCEDKEIKDVSLKPDDKEIVPKAEQDTDTGADSKSKIKGTENETIKAEVKNEEKTEIKTDNESKADVDMESDVDVKTDVKDEDAESVKSSASVSRKRSPPQTDSEGDDKEDHLAKKSRLDSLIGRLGSAVGKTPSELEEDEDNTSQVSVESEDGTTSSTKSEVPSTPTKTTIKQKAPCMTMKEFETKIAKKLTLMLEKRQNDMFESFRKRIEELQASNDSWKSQAKELQKQVLDLTNQIQRRERRQLTNGSRPIMRNMAIQVNEQKMQQFMSQIPATKNAPHMTPASSSLSTPVQGSTAGQVPTQVVLRTVAATTTTNAAVAQVKTSQGGVQYVASNNLRTIVQQAGATKTVASPSAQTASTVLPSTAGKQMTTTVRAMLDAQRVTTQRVVLQGSQVLKVSSQSGNTGTNNATPTTAKAGAQHTVASSAAGKQAVIDLTDDDDNQLKKAGIQNNSKFMTKTITAVTNASGQQQTLIRTGGLPIRPGTVLVPSSGGTVLMPSTGQVYVQQVVQNPRITTPGTAYMYTTQAGGAVAVRPAAASKPPQLRPAQLVAVKTSGTPMVANRQPPPLQSAPVQQSTVSRHPAPLPAQPLNQYTANAQGKMVPPKPNLKISRVQQGIVLSWNMSINNGYAEISNYQLFAYQESSTPANTSLWKKVGDVKALPLPMACTLTQFQEGNKYHFAVRALDVFGRIGPFSEPNSIHLTKQISN